MAASSEGIWTKVAGTWKHVWPVIALPWNKATGGTITEITESGKKYRVHVLANGDTFTVQSGNRPFEVLGVGGGSGGNRGASGGAFGGAAGPGQHSIENVTYTPGPYVAHIGTGGGQAGGAGSGGAAGGDTTLGSHVVKGGTPAGVGGTPFTTTFTGVSQHFCDTGGYNDKNPPQSPGSAGGNGGGGQWDFATPGISGFLAVRYEIA